MENSLLLNNEEYFPTINPSNEEKLSEIALAGEEDVNLAVKAARNAYNGIWSSISAKERGNTYTGLQD